MTSFTPGPWSSDESGWIYAPGEAEVCVYAGCSSHAAYWPNEADRRLALAAPEMFEALRNICDLAGLSGDAQLAEIADKAIKRAEGMES